MSQNPFEFQAGIPRRRPRSPLGKILVLVFLVAGAIGLGVGLAKNGFRFGHYFGATDISISDAELWQAYLDEKTADALYKNRWLRVTGDCSELQPTSTPPWAGSDVVEGHEVLLGKKETRLSTEWRIDCFIPHKSKDFAKVQEGGTLTILGQCKGKLGRQICLSECRIVEYTSRGQK